MVAAIPRINSDRPQHRAVALTETLPLAEVIARDFPEVTTHKLFHSQLKVAVLQSGW